MRNHALVLALLAACGGGGGGGGGSNTDKKDASTATPDAPPAYQAPPLPTCTPVNGSTVKVRQIGQVSGSAVLVTAPKNDGRLFVLEQQGRIRIFENEMLKPTPYLDITELPDFAAGGERGLLGLAFHPNFAYNLEFYVFYTTDTDNVVARYKQSATDLNKAEPAGEVILSIDDFAGNHNGGMIEFGPNDGYLYIGTGDGGGGGDPQRTSQNKDNLLGKILRIDVNATMGDKKYGIPADNPYAAGGGAPEIFMSGLRNPWRWSFDRENGDIYIGDVGQGGTGGANEIGIEEVTVLKAGEQAGKNLGWSMYEGTRCYRAPCNETGMTAPQYTRLGSDNWHSVIGGEVYRGTCFPDLAGYYFFTDYTARPLMRGKLEANGTLAVTELTRPAMWPNAPVSLHGDARGELFVTGEDGRIFQIEAGP